HLARVAADGAATDVGDAEIAGVDEADELGRLVVEQGVGPDRVAGAGPGVGEARPDVGAVDVGAAGVAAVAVGAAELDGFLEVRIETVLVTGDAAGALELF